MRVQGSKFLITGAASGIGKALALEVCRQGGDVTALDLQSDKLAELRKEVESLPGRLMAVRCDVGSDEQQKDAFQEHMRRFGRLDCAVMCAGIQERGCMFTAEEEREWQMQVKRPSPWSRLQDGPVKQMCLDVDLRAAMVGCRFAVRAMLQGKTAGVIVNVASAAGVYPAPLMPVYSTAAPRLLQKHGIRMSCLCPQFVDTPFLDPQKFPDAATREKILHTTLGAARYRGAARLLRVEEAAAALLGLLDDGTRAGTVRVLYQDGRCADLFQQQDRDLYPAAAALRPDPAALPRLRSWAQAALPSSYSKVQVHTLSSDFQQATRIVVQDLPSAIPDGHLLVRRAYAGVNASDINYTSGRYHASVKEAQDKLPFDAGMEAVGVVARAGPNTKLAAGSAVATMTFGGFAEYAVVPERHVLPVPTPDPRMLALLTSGLTASIALEQAGRMRHGEVVLVTAAAGGTGQFAVQLAKRAGNTVVATCSSAAKAALLRRLGADFVVNYREQNLRQVLKQHFPKGVDLAYESVGGDMFNTAANALAQRGRLIVIGMISQYAAGWPRGSYPGLAEKLLAKSASVVGFFLPHYTRLFRRHLAELVELWQRGQLEVEIDSSELFVGVRQVAAAVQHLHSGRSQGKVVVQMSPTAPPGVTPHARSAL